MGVDSIKDLLGLLSAVFIAVPWLREFRLKLDRNDMPGHRAAGAMARLVTRVEGRLQRRIESAKPLDLICTLFGLFLLGLSFLIGLIHGAATH